MQTEDLRLDGNAAGGILRDIFTHDMTSALVTCGGCGAKGPVGALPLYGWGMGVILRCTTCDRPLVRVVQTPGFTRVDLSGVALLTIPENVPPS